jgi:hypothetical protein
VKKYEHTDRSSHRWVTIGVTALLRGPLERKRSAASVRTHTPRWSKPDSGPGWSALRNASPEYLAEFRRLLNKEVTSQ